MDNKKIWRPKGSIKTKPRRITRSDDLRTMRPWEIRYYRNPDKDVTCWISQAWMTWQFKTERVVMVHIGSSETEKWVLITKL